MMIPVRTITIYESIADKMQNNSIITVLFELMRTLPLLCHCSVLKGYQQFRLKKPGGAGKKLYQAIKDVNQGCSVSLPRLVCLI